MGISPQHLKAFAIRAVFIMKSSATQKRYESAGFTPAQAQLFASEVHETYKKNKVAQTDPNKAFETLSIEVVRMLKFFMLIYAGRLPSS